MSVALDRSQHPVSFEVLADSTINQKKWLELRMLGVAASEAASLQGLSPWTSKYALWAQKTKRMPPEDLSGSEPVFWGQRLEWAIIAGYSEKTGRAVVPFGLLCRSLSYPVLLATPDALTTDRPDAKERSHQLNRAVGAMRRAIRQGKVVPFELVAEFEALAEGWFPLQVKNIGFNSAEHWHEGAPDYYRVQCQQEAIVLGKQLCSAAALVAGQSLIWEDIERDELADRRIVNLAQNFWHENVLDNVSPTVDGSDATTTALRRMYKVADPTKVLPLSASLLEVAEERDVLKEQIKSLEERVQAIDNRVRDEMKDASEGRFPDGSGFTYKQYETPEKTVVYPARSYRTLLRKKKPSDKAPRKKKTPLPEEST